LLCYVMQLDLRYARAVERIAARITGYAGFALVRRVTLTHAVGPVKS